jgi:hypothetical protein
MCLRPPSIDVGIIKRPIANRLRDRRTLNPYGGFLPLAAVRAPYEARKFPFANLCVNARPEMQRTMPSS